ncbi:ribosomal RNA small subunit methyltransferase A [Caedimonas varicaedens]|uniref:Ribosomal RNA small subunit methyltransferase A n=1 Tax=Caedimonas varicaedens TaxID=1629334 RepID=A0A0K8MDZ6_9PROT|nr:ribosomal RNA small subunit methyltransferase A [Caedimonas varicaedens]
MSLKNPVSRVDTTQETLLFLKRWLKHPLRLGAIAPSSPALTSLISRSISVKPENYIVELGAGTGTVTRRLLEYGIPSAQLYVVELDPELCAFLQKSLPNVHVIQGNATDLASLLPKEVIGKVSSVVSGMPMSTMPLNVQRKIIDACLEVMMPDGEIVQYSYHVTSPIPALKLGLSKKRIGTAFLNLPPASLWRYQKAA